MNALDIFQYDGADVRVVVGDDSEPWFVAADVARSLGYRMASDLTRRLDDDEKGTRSVRTPGGDQQVTVISESGLWGAALGSQVEKARPFSRWVRHDVLPAIRRTGQYVAPAEPESDAVLVARALQASARILEAKDAEIAVLTPKAGAWDELASGTGNYEVADAAKILANAGIETGRQRLFDQLADMGWIFRGPAGKWKARQTQVDAGYLAEKPTSHHHPRTGELVIDPPQVRVTVKGLERLRVRLGRFEQGAPALKLVGSAS